MRGPSCMLDGEIPAASLHDLQQLLPGLTGGEGHLECVFDTYQPVRGKTPARPRTDHYPLDRRAYLLHVARRR
jgi:ribosomal protection tetracycline resistance protein